MAANSTTWDAIVIGSGAGGPTAAAYPATPGRLARKLADGHRDAQPCVAVPAVCDTCTAITDVITSPVQLSRHLGDHSP